MIGRRVSGVASPLALGTLVRGGLDAARAHADMAERADALVEQRFGATRALVVDSGTSALVLALRLTVPPGGVVGFPGYACVDLAAAARFAGVRVRLYDLDPVTLSPDLDAIDRLLARGVDALVVAHLFGYPADVPEVRVRAARHGVPVIEDAAQAAGGSLRGRRLGTLGELSVLSFGRGKGLCAGGGGAILGFDSRWKGRLDALSLPPSARGWSNLGKTLAQWALGRPSLYALPSMIPALRLGEMVYHPAHEPTRMATASCSLLGAAIAREDADVGTRRGNASVFDDAVRVAPRLAAAMPLAAGRSGYLRYVVRDLGGKREGAAALGILRPYPRTLAEQEELQPVLVPGEPSTRGAIELRRTLFTLPTHHFVRDLDHQAIRGWLHDAIRRDVPRERAQSRDT